MERALHVVDLVDVPHGMRFQSARACFKGSPLRCIAFLLPPCLAGEYITGTECVKTCRALPSDLKPRVLSCMLILPTR